ncbi:MAG: ATP synthase F1 subunit delta [Planctomycetota bacterium]
MIRLDTPPDAVDKAYAKSLFELVESQGGRERLEEIASELEELVELARHQPELEEFVASRIIPATSKDRTLRAIFEGRISNVILNLMLLLNRKGRAGRFVRIAVAYDQLVQEQFGKVEVDIYTRYPIPQDQLQRLDEVLRTALRRDPVIYTYTDPSMLGGLKIRVGDSLLDASFTTRLRKMRELLKEEGSAVMRSRFEQSFEDN